MTNKEAIKEIADYFNLELTEFDKKKLLSIIDGLKIKQVVVEKVVEVAANEPITFAEINLNDYAEQACGKYQITHKQFMSKIRKGTFVAARCYFTRLVKKANRTYPDVWIATYLKVEHSTVNHYLYHCKIPMEIGRFKEPFTKVNSSIKKRK